MENAKLAKQHYETLDGLRGMAAIIIVLFHIFGMVNGFATPVNPFYHGMLPVDFFFGLSGFVISYAYDDRWGKMTVSNFFLRRLIRLHPTLVLGLILGALSYIFDPFKLGAQNAPIMQVVLIMVGAFFMLPNTPLPNRWTDLYSLNGPQWTLLDEYIANVAYAIALRKFPTSVIAILTFIAGCASLALGWHNNSMDSGWGWENFWLGLIRLAYPFLMGMLIYRLRDKLRVPKLGFITLSLILLASMCVPVLPKIGNIPLNGIYEAFLIIVVFPFVIASGAHSNSTGLKQKTCNYFGAISYPLYITHYPFLYMFLNLSTIVKAPTQTLIVAGFGFAILVAIAATIVEKYWDRPIRKWLGKKFGV